MPRRSSERGRAAQKKAGCKQPAEASKPFRGCHLAGREHGQMIFPLSIFGFDCAKDENPKFSP
jgi:hypothetical protein